MFYFVEAPPHPTHSSACYSVAAPESIWSLLCAPTLALLLILVVPTFNTLALPYSLLLHTYNNPCSVHATPLLCFACSSYICRTTLLCFACSSYMQQPCSALLLVLTCYNLALPCSALLYAQALHPLLEAAAQRECAQ